MNERENHTYRTGSVAAAASSTRAHGSRWRAAFCCAFIVLAVLKLWLAANLAPFVDEAFYWQESRHLAWSYSDVPGLTAWLIAAGEFAFGHSTLAMRAPFLLLGAAIPLLMVHMVARLFDARAGWQAGLWTLAMPLSATLGVLALPDVPLTFAAMLALYAFERAARDGRLHHWIALGLALALAWLAHYRAAMLMLPGLAFLLFTLRGRALWGQPGLWISFVIGLLGVLPLLIFNLEHDWQAFGFQFVDRHPWTFHADALVQPLEQALVVTPLLYGLLLVVLLAAVRRMRIGAPWDLFAWSALLPLLAYFVFGLFADDERFRVHWPLPAYLPLLALLPIVMRDSFARRRNQRFRHGAMIAAALCAACGSGIVLGYLAIAADAARSTQLAGSKAFPDHFVGWNETGKLARELLANGDSGNTALVADNFMLAAQLDFTFDGQRAVYSLDSPLNTKHGRASQLAAWSRDEAALRRHAGQRVLLVVDETALRERARAAWLDQLCARIEVMQPLRRLDLFDSRKRIAFYSGRVPEAATGSSECRYPPAVPVTESTRQSRAAGGTG